MLVALPRIYLRPIIFRFFAVFYRLLPTDATTSAQSPKTPERGNMSRKQLAASLRLWERRHRYRTRRLSRAHAANDSVRVAHWHRLLEEAGVMVKRRRGQIAELRELRLRAFDVAEGMIGVMERGGNNAGPAVARIICANGGIGPEAWCGDFAAYCYRLAGSKAVTRAWASVRLVGMLAGVRRAVRPAKGDLVRFRFDHIGIFAEDLGDGTIQTIEGNTGALGAVSDSTTGGDGVYRKVRSKKLVSDYLRVTR